MVKADVARDFVKTQCQQSGQSRQSGSSFHDQEFKDAGMKSFAISEMMMENKQISLEAILVGLVGLSNGQVQILQNQTSIKQGQFGLKERVDVSYDMMDFLIQSQACIRETQLTTL